ncbi:MAG TPA: hypothetical protein VGK61_04310 [Planctomycetota bacterium]|jgi:hypothetical protein
MPNYAWKERKKFAIPVGGGALGLLVWYFMLLSPLNTSTDRLVQQRRGAEGQLRLRLQAGVPQPETVDRAEKEQKQLKSDLGRIREDMEFKVDEAFRAKEGENLQTKMGRQRDEVRVAVEKRCGERGFPQIDSRLGFPSSFAELPDVVLPEWLIRLAVVKHLCFLAMDSGVEKLELVEVVPAEHQDEALAPADRFLGRLTVKFRVIGASDAIMKLVHGLQQKGGKFLALEACAIKIADPTRDLLGAEIAAGALVIHPDKPVAVEGKP